LSAQQPGGQQVTENKAHSTATEKTDQGCWQTEGEGEEEEVESPPEDEDSDTTFNNKAHILSSQIQVNS